MNLDIAVCPGCGLAYTRGEMAAILERDQGFTCDCGLEYNGPPYRPRTIRELCAGKSAGRFAPDAIDLAAYTRAVVKVLAGQGCIAEEEEGVKING